MSPTTPARFRERLVARELLLGTFIKTPVTHPVEIIGSAGFDFVVIDQEHAPFDRVTLDALILAGRAVGTAVLVRAPSGVHLSMALNRALPVPWDARE